MALQRCTRTIGRYVPYYMINLLIHKNELITDVIQCELSLRG